MKEFSKALNIDISDVEIFPEADVTITQVPMPTSAESAQAGQDNTTTVETGQGPATAQAPSVGDKDALVRGIAEITEVMLGEFKLNDVLAMILENIYTGMGFTRALFCIFDRRNNQIVGRFGLGKQIDEIAARFRGRIESSDDIVSVAVTRNRDFIVLDSNSSEYRDRIPYWLRKLTAPHTVVLYPIFLKNRCIGVIYADTDDASTNISMDALGFFKTLRNQASMAIQQSQMR